MSVNILNAGYVRINHAMTNLMTAVRKGNKDEVIKIAGNLADDCDDFIEAAYTEAGVSDDDISKTAEGDDESLTKQAMWGFEASGFQDESAPTQSDASPDEPTSI